MRERRDKADSTSESAFKLEGDLFLPNEDCG